MADNGRTQIFPYSLKTVSAPINSGFNIPEIGLEVNLAQNHYSTELLRHRVRIIFDSSMTSTYKQLTAIRVQQINKTTGVLIKNVVRPIVKTAVGNTLEFNFDFTPYIDKANRNIIWLQLGLDQDLSFGHTNIFTNYSHTIALWKADMAYTVKGIAQ